MSPDPNHMPRGTYPVDLRCLCKRNARYFSVRCPDVAKHGRHEDEDWWSEDPPFGAEVMRAVREYHAQVMADAARKRREARGDAA